MKTLSASSSKSSGRSSESHIGTCSETIPKQRKITIDLWENVEKELVEKLPADINGLSAFKITGLSTNKKMVSALIVGRKWKKIVRQTGMAIPVYGTQIAKVLSNALNQNVLSKCNTWL